MHKEKYLFIALGVVALFALVGALSIHDSVNIQALRSSRDMTNIYYDFDVVIGGDYKRSVSVIYDIRDESYQVIGIGSNQLRRANVSLIKNRDNKLVGLNIDGQKFISNINNIEYLKP